MQPQIQKSASKYCEAADDEITILQQIREGDPDDKYCCVQLLGSFRHRGPNGQHVCMVFPVTTMPADTDRERR